MDAGFIAPLIVKMQNMFNITLIEIAFFLSLLTLIPALLNPTFGILADKYKRLVIIFIAILCGATVSTLMVVVILFTQNFMLFATLGILAAIINIAIGPAVFSLLVDFVPAKNRAGVIGWMGIAGTTAVGLGFIVSGIIPGIIFGPDFPLWFPYAFDAVAGFIFAGLTLLIKEPPRGIQEEGLQDLYESGKKYEYTLTFDGAKGYITKRMNQKIISFLVFVRLLSGMLGAYFITFLIVNHGFTVGNATSLMMLIFAVQLFGQVYWGKKGDQAFQAQKDRHVKIMIKTLTISILLVTWIWFIQADLWFVVFCIVLAVGSFYGVGVNPNIGAVVAAVNPPEIRATANSVNFLVTIVVKSVMLVLFALICVNLLNSNYALTFFFFSLFYIPALAILFSMKKTIIHTIENVQEELKEKSTIKN